MPVEITTTDGGTGLAGFDPITRHWTSLSFPSPVAPAERDAEFTFPVARTVAVSTTAFRAQTSSVQVFAADGSHVTNIDPEGPGCTLSAGEYYIGVNTA